MDEVLLYFMFFFFCIFYAKIYLFIRKNMFYFILYWEKSSILRIFIYYFFCIENYVLF